MTASHLEMVAPAAAFIDDREAATFLGLSRSYMRQLRVAGGGPRFYRISAKAIRYKRSDLSEWAEARAATSTSDRG